MLISPTEPAALKEIGEVSGMPERYGVDVLIVEGNRLTGVQRKKFPSDFLASLSDGRLPEQLQQMEKLHRRLLVIEGFGQWTTDGVLVDRRQFTRNQFWGLLFSISFEFGVECLQVRDVTETVHLLQALEAWAGKEKHTSLLRRPGPKKDGWGRVSERASGMFVLQSFGGIGPELAGRIYDHFGGLPLRWAVDGPEDLQKVPGIGKGKAKKLWDALK